MNDLRERIRAHYDRLTPLYLHLWGEHIHHGYWDIDDASKTAPEAQEKLTRLLAEKAKIPRGGRVLDVGCGLGGSSRWLASRLGCKVVGLTLSHVQAAAALGASRSLGDSVDFVQADAARLPVRLGSFDAVWIVECAEHIEDKRALMHEFGRALRPSAVLAMCGWFRGEGSLSHSQTEQLSEVMNGMLLPSLASMTETSGWIEEAGITVRESADITERVRRTWDICIEITRGPIASLFLRDIDDDTLRFIDSFGAMKLAYESGALRYGLIAAGR